MRAIERLNELLNGFLNPDGEVYKELIGDYTREYNPTDAVTGGTTEYSSGDFTDLTDEFNCTPLLPVQTDLGECNVYIGDYHWVCQEDSGDKRVFSGQNVGSAGGAFRIKVKTGGIWDQIAKVGNGIKTLYFPPLGIGQMQVETTNIVGYSTLTTNQNIISMYFIRGAFTFAFLGNDSDIIVTTDGSVYKDSISTENLVVNGSGEVGLAGGGNTRALITDENTGIISNMLGYIKRMQDFIVKQVSLKTASSTFLTSLGQNYFAIFREAGETDNLYRDRIPTTVLLKKESPINIENLILPYCEKVYIDDDAESGSFSDITFADQDLEFFSTTENGWIMSCRTGEKYGLIYHFVVYILKPIDGLEKTINNIILKSKVGGVTYDVFAFDKEIDYNKALGI